MELVELLVVLLTLEVAFVEFEVLLEDDWESEIELELSDELEEELPEEELPELEPPEELPEEPELEDPLELEEGTLWTDWELDPPPVLVTSSGWGPSCPGWALTNDMHKQTHIKNVKINIVFLFILNPPKKIKEEVKKTSKH